MCVLAWSFSPGHHARLQAGTARSISGAIEAEPITALWRGMGPLLAVQPISKPNRNRNRDPDPNLNPNPTPNPDQVQPISNALMFVGYGAGKGYAERNHLTGGSALLPVFIGGCAGQG